MTPACHTQESRYLLQRASSLLLGLFGASTGAAAALIAAAARPDSVRAIVSRGGRPDLAEPSLPIIATPTLLIVVGEDDPVIRLNTEAFTRLNGPKPLHIVPRCPDSHGSGSSTISREGLPRAVARQRDAVRVVPPPREQVR